MYLMLKIDDRYKGYRINRILGVPTFFNVENIIEEKMIMDDGESNIISSVKRL